MKVILYTDGGARGNGKANNVGGYGVVMQFGEHTKELYEGFRGVTNNQMEIRAVIDALEAMKKTNLPVEVRSDSAYVVNCINQGWYKKWMNNGWLTSGRKPVENRELWIELIEQINRFPFISFVKVKGHSTDEGNNRADALANLAMNEMEAV
jgi:ribonuclease HI